MLKYDWLDILYKVCNVVKRNKGIRLVEFARHFKIARSTLMYGVKDILKLKVDVSNDLLKIGHVDYLKPKGEEIKKSESNEIDNLKKRLENKHWLKMLSVR